MTTHKTTATTAPFINFGGKRVVVTGASSGIGRAVAIELSRRGASLVLMGRDRERLEETALQLATPQAELVLLDLSDPTLIQEALKPLVAKVGRFYGLCHCAGVVQTVPLHAIDVQGLQYVFNVNVTAGIELARVISRRDCMESDGGAIVFISSVYAAVGKPGQIGYSASKGALVSAARAMAVELARRRIRVNTLSPGLVHTPLADQALKNLTEADAQKLEDAHPLGAGTPEDVARVAAFLLAPESRWITGTDFIVDGGYSAQ